jgi:hypothetical protein
MQLAVQGKENLQTEVVIAEYTQTSDDPLMYSLMSSWKCSKTRAFSSKQSVCEKNHLMSTVRDYCEISRKLLHGKTPEECQVSQQRSPTCLWSLVRLSRECFLLSLCEDDMLSTVLRSLNIHWPRVNL